MSFVAEDPYVGLRAFDGGDRHRFFGRAQQSRELHALWLSHRLVVLYGPSGVGKTSLIQAGVVADIEDARADVLPIGRTTPTAASPSVLPAVQASAGNPYVYALLSDWLAAETPIRLAGLSVTQGLHLRPPRTDRHGDPLPILAVIDQFEEVLTDPAPWAAYRQDFLAQLSDALKEFPSLRLLIALREEFLPGLMRYEPELAGHSRARLRLRPLEPQEAVTAVTGPLAGTGRSFAAGAAERLVEDLRTVELTDPLGRRVPVVDETVEPWLLQVACSTLWERLPEERSTITTEWLRGFGDVNNILADHCERAMAEVAEAQGLSEAEVRRWLTDGFITELGTRGAVYEGFSETGGLPNAVASDLEQARILRAEQRAGARWYELSHDRLVEYLRPAPSTLSPENVKPGPVEYLNAARGALAEGDIAQAADYAAGALRIATDEQVRVRAEAEAFLAGIAAQRGQIDGGKIDEAVRRYERAARLFELLGASSAVARSLAAVGRLLMEQGRHAAAITKLHAALARSPGAPALRAELAEAHWRSGQPAAAAAIFSSILTLSRDHPVALSGHAQILADRGNYADALEELDLLRTRHPQLAKRAEIRSARAVALAGTGRTTEAWHEVAAAVMSGDPPPGVVLWRAAQVAAAAGDETLAIGYLRRALDSAVPLFMHMFAEARDMLQRLEA